MEQSPKDKTKLTKIKKKEPSDHSIINTMIKGIITLLPIILMLFIIVFLFNLVLNVLSPISYALTGGGTAGWFIHILSFAILLAIFYMAGVFISSRLGNVYFSQFEKAYLDNIPLYSTLRKTVQQFSGTKEMPFQQVVLVDAFKTGSKMTGFITQRINDDLFTVYVPTAPNPTNGNIFHINADQLDFIDVDSETAMRTVISMGTGSEQLFNQLIEEE